MIGVAELSGIMSSLKAAKDIAEAMIGLRDVATMQTKVIEFQNAIMDAQQRVFSAQEERSSLIEQVRHLEEQMARMKAWETEKQRYEQKRVGYGGGVFVYQLKADAAGAELPHSICANCYENGQRSILQGDRAKGDAFLCCSRCKARLLTDGHGNSRQ